MEIHLVQGRESNFVLKIGLKERENDGFRSTYTKIGTTQRRLA